MKNIFKTPSRLVKRVFFIVLVLLVFVVAFLIIQTARHSSSLELSEKPTESIRLATYNVHYIRADERAGNWSVGDWNERKEPMSRAVSSLGADVIAFQEMESFTGGDRADTENLTRSYLLENNPEFKAGAVGDPTDFPSTQPIFYREDDLRLQDQGWFFFSDTPDEIYSRTFNGSFPAFASWVRLEERETGKSFRVVNIHVDFASKSNRLQSLALVKRRTSAWRENGERVFVVGDFNARLGSDTLQILKDVGMEFAGVSAATYHFNHGINIFGAIDHFAYSQNVEISGEPVVVQKKFLGKWPTDHYPVVADFRLKE